MADIVKVHHPAIGSKLLQQCLTKFYWLREIRGIRKRPSTSELVDWIGALIAAGIPQETIVAEIPFLGSLIKKEEDIDLVANASGAGDHRSPSWRT